MLAPAQLYTDELKRKLWEIAFEEHYMYFNSGYTDEYQPSNSTWNEQEFASLDSNGDVMGYIRYGINQRNQVCSGLCAVNFTTKITFARDLLKAIDDIFCKYKYRKLKYGVYIGNPIESTYDKLTSKYNGRIVGIYKQDCKLLDGEYHDYKEYELFREDYITAKQD